MQSHIPAVSVRGYQALRAAMTIARFVLLEARRSGLPLMLIVTVVGCTGLAMFVSQLALTESANLQSGVLAALFRVAVIFLTAAFVISSFVRESGDKGIELLLSLPISRSTYYLGKLAGFAACGGIFALVVSLALLGWSPFLPVAAWFASLVMETALMAAISLFLVVSLGHVVSALSLVAGIYLLARVMGAVQSISVSPLFEDQDTARRIASWCIDLISMLLPPLDKATQTAWLLYGPPTREEFLSLTGGLIVYGMLIAAAGLFDFHRRNL